MENKQTNLDVNKSAALDKALDAMLENGKTNDMDCSSGVCIIKGDKSIVERINKKIITEDGRQLLY
jgi:NADH:ubiquinone oxidoreductase subunit E